MLSSIEEHFRAIEDPRVERNKKHKLLDIIVLAICGVVSGAEGWEAIEEFGYEKQQWLRKYLELANGIPSHDCIARVLSRISPSEMTECFIAWTRSVSQLTAGEVVAIDGKTLRHSYNTKEKLGAIHMVSAWASQAVRAHWGIENSLHWVLDVTFREDDCRIRRGDSPANFNIIRQVSLNLLKRERSKLSIKRKRFKAALSDSFRENIFSLSD